MHFCRPGANIPHLSRESWATILSLLVFGATYVGILTERLHRTFVVILGAVAMIMIGTWLSFYSPEQAVAAADANTIALLLGMMVLVGMFRETGLFEYVAIWVAKLARGRSWLLFIYLGAATTVISMLLDNVTTIILMIPVTMSLADILGVPMVPFLIGEVMLSNIGGVGTLIGDPPNILIGSAAGLTFTDFITHLLPVVLVVWVIAQGFLLFLFRRDLIKAPEHVDQLMSTDERKALTEPKAAGRLLVVLGATVILFFIHDRIGLESGIVALIGASGGLLWLWPDVKKALDEVHWGVLLFFIGLFVIVGGLEASGALDVVAHTIASLSRYGIVLSALVILWVSAFMSAIVDNVPFTIAMLPILGGLSAHGVHAGPLWWALALGVGFGGNATPVGATANVIVMSYSSKTREPISSGMWIRRGLPTTLLSCVAASLLLVLAIAIGWY